MRLRSDKDLVDDHLSAVIDPETRESIWSSVENILAHGPISQPEKANTIGLALGYVQSGKTSSITALIAQAADQGYRIVVALLGSTNLLLEQNQTRISQALNLAERADYRWTTEEKLGGRSGTEKVRQWLERDRVVFIPILKHAKRINSVAKVLSGLEMQNVPVLIVDDEADQASLNTQKDDNESATYRAIGELRRAAPRHLYVQYTATPYAPLLLEPADRMLPEFIEFLTPGPSYIGGREFFLDHAKTVVRNVPNLDEQRPKDLLTELPDSLEIALSSFVAGAALLLGADNRNAPISMLVHSTHLTNIHSIYVTLLKRTIALWREQARKSTSVETLPASIFAEKSRLIEAGASNLRDDYFINSVLEVLEELSVWLVNSAGDQEKVNWRQTPVHLLVGGNKLDRGFTVEGLTVTYINRPTSPQVDTMEQRARAFGYRQDQLPYCQFFGTKRTINLLRDVVHTEYDLRAKLQDHVEAGGTIDSWAKEVGLLLPADTRPTRPAVVKALSSSAKGWHSLRRPSLEHADRRSQAIVATANALFEAITTERPSTGLEGLVAIQRAPDLESLGDAAIAAIFGER